MVAGSACARATSPTWCSAASACSVDHAVPTTHWLLLSMLGVGSPGLDPVDAHYALLSDSDTGGQMGVYMGIFHFFIVIPQLVAVSVLGLLGKSAVRQPADLRAADRRRQHLVLAGLFALRVPNPPRHRHERNGRSLFVRTAEKLRRSPSGKHMKAHRRPRFRHRHRRLRANAAAFRRRPTCTARWSPSPRIRWLRDDRSLRRRRSVQRPSRPGARARAQARRSSPSTARCQTPPPGRSDNVGYLGSDFGASSTTPATSAAWASPRCG